MKIPTQLFGGPADGEPALLRVARAAKAIRERNQVSDWVFTDTGELSDHGELFAALSELDTP